MVEYYRQTDNSARVRATTWVRDDEKVLEHVRRSDIAQALNGVTWVRLYIEDIRSDYGDLLHQFDGSILDEIDGTLDRLVDACYSEIFEHAEGVEFIPDEYGNPVEMEDAVYETFMLSDEVRGIVKDLEKLGERVSDTQTDVVQTSFS
ncbi:hypothetical protein D3261_10470 [Halococcus sp. IIIV-5B]|nr:hypothetical protein D3261_10470 [Halococcus sp. IIIV-5B]